MILGLNLSSPEVSKLHFAGIGLLGIFSLILGILILNKTNQANGFNLRSMNTFFKYYDSLVAILLILCFSSILITLLENLGMFKFGFSYPLRLISTAYQPLAPLESRLLHTVVPFSVLVNFGSKKTKAFNFYSLFLLVFLLQIKIGPIILMIIIFLRFLSHKKLPSLIIQTLVSCIILAHTSLTYSKDYIKMAEEYFPNTKKSIAFKSKVVISGCDQSTDSSLINFENKFAEEGIKYYPFYRTFILPAIISRLFVCSYDHGFIGKFRGHQLAKIFGMYLPTYNQLYRHYFLEDSNNPNANAVGNSIYDSFFQAGWPGVIVCCLIIIIIAVIIQMLELNNDIKFLCYFLKFQFIYGIASASIISVLIFFAPLILMIIFLYGETRFRTPSNA